jgi:hypothetical protein
MYTILVNSETKFSNKKLPIVLQKEINSALYYALPLCVILTEEKLKSWFYEHFIETYYYNGSYNYLEDDMIKGGFNSILDKIRFSYSNLDEINIIDIIIDGINNGCYCYIYLDEFYLPAKGNFNHFYHESLIYGYDNNKNKFLAIAFDKNMSFDKLEYDYKSLINAFKSGKEIALNDFPVTLFKIRDFENSYPFNLSRFVTKLSNYINSIYKNQDYMYYANLQDILSHSNIGISGYPQFLAHINKQINTLNYSNFMNVHFIYEHKKGLINRLAFIKEKFLSSEKLDDLINELNEITQKYLTARNLIMKYIILSEQEKNIPINKLTKISSQIIDILEKNIIKEKEVLEYIYMELKKLNTFYKPVTLQKDIGKVAQINPELLESDKNTLNKIIINLKRLCNYDLEGKHFQSKTFKWETQKTINRIDIIINSDSVPFINTVVLLFSDTSFKLINHVENDIDMLKNISFDSKDIKWIKCYIMFDSQSNINEWNIYFYEVSLSYKKPIVSSSVWEISPGISNPEYLPTKAVDGLTNTYWNAKNLTGAGEYLEIDLLSLEKINVIVIIQRPDCNRIKGYKLLYANEGKNWKVIYECSDNLIGNEPITHIFPTIYSKYLKLLITETQIVNGFGEPGIQTFDAYFSSPDSIG